MKALVYQLQEDDIKQWKKIYLEEPQKNIKHKKSTKMSFKRYVNLDILKIVLD